MASKYSYYENAAVYVALASVLVSEQARGPKGPFQVFCCADLPGAHALASRLSTGLHCKYPAYVLALLYLRSLKEVPAQLFSINMNTFQRVVATAAVVASKFFDDVYYSNEYYAAELGLAVSELNEMEVALIVMLDYRLQVEPDVFRRALSYFDRSRIWYCQNQECDAFSGLRTVQLPEAAELLAALAHDHTVLHALPLERQKGVLGYLRTRTRGDARFDSEEEHLAKTRLQIKAKCISKLQDQAKQEARLAKLKERVPVRVGPDHALVHLKATAAV